METSLEGNLGQPKSGPSDSLIKIFRACSRDPTATVSRRLRRLWDIFVQHHRDQAAHNRIMTTELAVKCCCEAERHYYRILEIIVSQEKKRLGINDVSAVFEHDLFQCCLAACCLEIAMFSHNLPSDVHQVLQLFDLAPYDFCKVIGLVLRADDRLPKNVDQHLWQIEERVLQSLAWTQDSPLWQEIRANQGQLPACQQVMLPTQLEDPNRTDVHPHQTPSAVNPSLGAEPSASGEQQSHQTAVKKSSSLSLFLRKVYILMDHHLKQLCAALKICDELRFKIWACFEYSLTCCAELMVDRHLDQLLMCAICLTAKISEAEVPLKQIMKCYKRQPYSTKHVCNKALISSGQTENSPTRNNDIGDHTGGIPTPNTPSTHYPPSQEEWGNLMSFYNQIYIIKMAPFVQLSVLTSSRGTPPLSSCPAQWVGSPHRRHVCTNLSMFILPSSTESTPSVKRSLCYYFSSSSSQRLHEINAMIQTGNLSNWPRSTLVNKRQEEGETEEAGDGPPLKRPHLDGLTALDRRLRDLENDRAQCRNQNPSCQPQ